MSKFNIVFKEFTKNRLFELENVLKGLFLGSMIFFQSFANTLCFLVCVLGFYRQQKNFGCNRIYLMSVLKNDFIHNLMYMTCFMLLPQFRTILYYLPLAIHFWIGICQFVNIRMQFLYQKTQRVMAATTYNRELLMIQKNKIEIYMIGFIIFQGLTIVKPITASIIMLFVYINYLRLKHKLSDLMQQAFRDCDKWITDKMDQPTSFKINKLLAKMIRKLCNLLKFK